MINLISTMEMLVKDTCFYVCVHVSPHCVCVCVCPPVRVCVCVSPRPCVCVCVCVCVFVWCENQLPTSCGGMSNEMVLKSIFLTLSIHGNIKNSPTHKHTSSPHTYSSSNTHTHTHTHTVTHTHTHLVPLHGQTQHVQAEI